MCVTGTDTVRKRPNVKRRYVEVTINKAPSVCHLDQQIQNLTRNQDCLWALSLPASPSSFLSHFPLPLREQKHNLTSSRCEYIHSQHFLSLVLLLNAAYRWFGGGKVGKFSHTAKAPPVMCLSDQGQGPPGRPSWNHTLLCLGCPHAHLTEGHLAWEEEIYFFLKNISHSEKWHGWATCVVRVVLILIQSEIQAGLSGLIIFFLKPKSHCKAKMEWLEFQKTSAYALSPILVM